MQIREKKIEEIRPTNILPQTPFWGRIKNEQGFIPYGFEITVSKDLLLHSKNSKTERVRDDLLILIKYIHRDHCFAYVPYGPTLEPDFEHQGIFLEELSETLRPFLPSECDFIRYDLKWENQWAQEDDYFDSSGNWIGPPQSRFQEFRVNYSTEKWNLRKSPVDILPKNTFLLDLTLKKEELLYEMRYNTRYNIKQALKRGIRIKEYGVEHIDEWYSLYEETAVRHKLSMQNKDFFSNILKNQDNSPGGVRVKMLMAHDGNRFLASMFLVLSNKRGTYLYGATTSDKKNLMAGYALQWEAIKMAKDRGCVEYDMFGSAPNLNRNHPLHGVHVYKKGFGGHLFHRMGCWDYPFAPNIYESIKMQESNSN